MPKTRHQKEDEVQILADKFAQSKSVVVATQESVAVRDIETLRRELRQNDSELKSIKKSLLTLSLQKNKQEFDTDSLQTGIAIAFSYGDEVSAAKALHVFSKEHEGLQIAGGFLGNEKLSAEQMIALAKLPGKQELLGMFVRTVHAPVTGFVNVLAGNIRNVINVLNAYKATKE